MVRSDGHPDDRMSRDLDPSEVLGFCANTAGALRGQLGPTLERPDCLSRIADRDVVTVRRVEK